MYYYSTGGSVDRVSFRQALFNGLAQDGGLYMPENIPTFNHDFFVNTQSYSELAFTMIQPFVKNDIPDSVLENIVEEAFNFDVPIQSMSDRFHILELFHGPTCAFKDFAARFMARTMEYFQGNSDKELTILVATSGDTGSAVANGFLGLDGIKVVILYPWGRVSEIQEKQLTTLGGNITALEVAGNFDDCQAMVKSAFMDTSLRTKRRLSSANSINISRLLPQSVYFAWAWKQLGGNEPAVFSVPCGNFGNITGGLFAKEMGIPVKQFIAATNENDVFPNYLRRGSYKPMPSKHTLSNAMDVGDPSNLARIENLYENNLDNIRHDINSWSFSDTETQNTISTMYEKYDYVPDPHTAVGILGLEKYNKMTDRDEMGVVISTAHPGKFADLVSPIIHDEIPIPKNLLKDMNKQKISIKIRNEYSVLKDFLLKS